MNLIIALLAAAASAMPLIVLVTRADKNGHAIAALQLARERGLMTKEEFECRASQILRRSCWMPAVGVAQLWRLGKR
jgi:hypothetical protein